MKRKSIKVQDWKVPDWRKPERYPMLPSESDDTELDQWRWEFLRRDPQYREDWLRFLKLDHPFKLSLIKDPTEEGFDLPKYPEEFPDRHRDIWYVLRVYKLSRLLNPSISKPSFLRFYPVPTHSALIWFDLEGSIKEELKYARNLLDRHQRAVRKKLRRYKLPHKRDWPTFLRILDAHNDKEILETIGYEILGVNPRIHGEETAISNAESKLRTASSMWKNIPMKCLPLGWGMSLAVEDDFDDIVPPGLYPRTVLPRV